MVNAIAQGQEDRDTMAKELHSQQTRLKKFEGQLKRQEDSLEAIQDSLEAIHARLKEQAKELANVAPPTSTKSKKSRLAAERSLAKKLNRVEQSIAQVKSPPPPPTPQMTSEDEKNSYTAAYLALKSGRYDEASATFEKLLRDFPKGEFSDQAYYWLGESYYAQNKLRSAIRAFNQVVANYPDSAKYATALLRLGTTYKETGNINKANATFQRLIRERPNSPEAENARSLMQAQQNGKHPSR